MTRLALTTVLGLALLAPGYAQEKPKTEVLGFLVRKAPPKGGNENNFFARPGTFVEMGLVCPAHEIVGLDRDASKATAKDDKGTDLSRTSAANKFDSGPFDMMPRVSDDKHRAAFQLRFDGTPAVGAKSFAVTGSVAIQVGSGIKSVEFKDVATGKPGETKSGAFELKVDQKTDDGVSLTFTTDKPNFKSIAFLGSDGAKLPAQSVGSFSSKFLGKVSYGRQFTVAKPTETIAVKVEYFEKIETLTVPLEATLGLGLTPAAEATAAKGAPVVALWVGKKKTPEWEKVVSFDFKEGTGVQVLVSHAEKSLLDVAGFQNETKSASDDKGTDLQKGERGRVSKSFGDAPVAGAVKVELSAPGIPAAGAGAVRFAAEVEFVAGSDVKTVEKKGVSLKTGTAATLVEGIKVTVEEKFGQKTLKFDLAKTDLASVEFADAKGKPVKAQQQGWSGGPGADERTVFYSFEKAPAAVGIKASYYGKIEKVKLPIEVTVGLGF